MSSSTSGNTTPKGLQDKIEISKLLKDFGTLEDQLQLCADNAELRQQLAANPFVQSSFNPVVLGCEGFRVEDGTENPLLVFKMDAMNKKKRSASTDSMFLGNMHDSERMIMIENAEIETAWYSKYFLGRPHQIFIGTEEEKAIYLISAMLDDEDETVVVRAILWRKEGVERISIPADKKTEISKLDLLKAFNPQYAKWNKPREVSDKAIIKEILAMEEQLSSKTYKFGVVYARDDQLSDEEFYGNHNASPDFEKFLEILGDVIPLKGWDGFRGGLDVTTNNTGEKSVYTQFLGHEIMFHVSTMLPRSDTNKQQLERKRHIGNDIVVILFQDGELTPFSPALMRSQFNHIFAVVRKVTIDDKPAYRLALSIKNTVPAFGPPLPYPPTFTNLTYLRRFLLTKLINGEQAAFQAPAFKDSMTRTFEDMLKRLYNTFLVEKLESSRLIKRASTGRLLLPSATTPQDDLVTFGQKIKEEILAKQQIVQSTISARPDQEPAQWKADIFSKGFPLEIKCCDVWGDSLVVGTVGGVFLVRPNGAIQQLLEKGNFKQIVVVESAMTMFALTDKAGNLYAFNLGEFVDGNTIVGKAVEHKIEKTKGANIFAVSGESVANDPLFSDTIPTYKICIAIRNTVAVYTYQPMDSTANAPINFKKIKGQNDLYVPEMVSVMSFCDFSRKICVAFKTEFHSIDLYDAQVRILFDSEQKLNPITAIALDEEILLCFSHLGIFRDMEAKPTREYELNWTSTPTGLVYRFPFVLAFTQTSVEVRTLINGKLVQNLPLPSPLRFAAAKSNIFVLANQPSGATDIYRMISP